jgi:ElaB/YqjD/DUF883 family membrane-anchored ribosome-binding protein
LADCKSATQQVGNPRYRVGEDPIGSQGDANVSSAVRAAESNNSYELDVIEKAKPIMETRSAEEIESTTEKLLQDLKAVVQDGEELIREGAQNLTERGMAARERLAAALEAARETRRKLESQARAGLKATDHVIREHPYQAVGVAFGIGLLLGVLANRR